jgi:hypothetical protein
MYQVLARIVSLVGIACIHRSYLVLSIAEQYFDRVVYSKAVELESELDESREFMSLTHRIVDTEWMDFDWRSEMTREAKHIACDDTSIE